jgi:DNA-binding transcriptional MocR family regulator
VRACERIGLELFVEPADGMFIWARFPHIEDSLVLAEAAQHRGLMLAPGTVFRPHLERSPWMRLNVAVCEDPRVQHLLERLGSSLAG